MSSQPDVLRCGVGPLVGFADIAPEGGAVLSVSGLGADLLFAFPGSPGRGDEPGPHRVAGEPDGEPSAFGVAGDDLSAGFWGQVVCTDVAPDVDGHERGGARDSGGGLPCEPGGAGAGGGR